MICVYPADCKDFSNNGLGIVLPQSCTVTETLNGEWELTLVRPIDVDGKWTRLKEGCILRAPVPAAMTPQVGLVTRQYQTTVYDILIYYDTKCLINASPGKHKPFRVSVFTGFKGSALAGA